MLDFIGREEHDRCQYLYTNSVSTIIRDRRLPNFLAFPSLVGNNRSLIAFCQERPTHRGGRLHSSSRSGWKHLPHGAAADPRDRVACFQFIFRRLDFPSCPFHAIGTAEERDREITVCENRSTRNQTNSSRHFYSDVRGYYRIAKDCEGRKKAGKAENGWEKGGIAKYFWNTRMCAHFMSIE